MVAVVVAVVVVVGGGWWWVVVGAWWVRGDGDGGGDDGDGDSGAPSRYSVSENCRHRIPGPLARLGVVQKVPEDPWL